MPLNAGDRHAGHFDVAGPLGAGGMGEVYRARDTRLNRDVALKILPDAFAADPDLRAAELARAVPPGGRRGLGFLLGGWLALPRRTCCTNRKVELSI